MITESEVYSLIAPMANRQEMKVEDFLKDLRECFSKEKGESLDLVLKVVSEVFCVDEDLLKSRHRDNHIVSATQMYCFLANRYTSASLKQIGYLINKDHTTVIHSIRSVNYDLINNPYLKELKSKCVRRLINGDR